MFKPLPVSKVWHATHQDCKIFPKNSKKILTIHDLNYIHQRSNNKAKVDHYLKTSGKN